MRRGDFAYTLPADRIAQFPLPSRRDSRLLVCRGEARIDARFDDITGYLRAGDVLVVNDTRVQPARLFGRKRSGGRVELLFERALTPQTMLCAVRSNRPVDAGVVIAIADGVTVTVTERRDSFVVCRLDDQTVTIQTVLDRYGRVPLPPYIDREPTVADDERYQTVFARHHGAVAAPTAGLHFDEALLDTIRAIGVTVCPVTLHVGAGTFTPIRTDDINDHRMHSEWLQIDNQVAQLVNEAERVVAVGTTSLRALESVYARFGRVQAYDGETDLYITPGYRFGVVDVLLTNFHAPLSTLLVLVAAFMGYERMRAAYDHALAGEYRFLSYGDAMWIERG